MVWAPGLKASLRYFLKVLYFDSSAPELASDIDERGQELHLLLELLGFRVSRILSPKP